MANGGLTHDPPAWEKYNKAASLAQKEEEKKEGGDAVPYTPS